MELIIAAPLFGFVIWLVGAKWIDYYFQRKGEFIQNLIDNSEDGENA